MHGTSPDRGGPRFGPENLTWAVKTFNKVILAHASNYLTTPSVGYRSFKVYCVSVVGSVYAPDYYTNTSKTFS